MTYAPLFIGPSGNGFIRIQLLKHRYIGGSTTLETRDVFVRKKTVAIIV
jgi:hypothetical protein